MPSDSPCSTPNSNSIISSSQLENTSVQVDVPNEILESLKTFTDYTKYIKFFYENDKIKCIVNKEMHSSNELTINNILKRNNALENQLTNNHKAFLKLEKKYKALSTLLVATSEEIEIINWFKNSFFLISSKQKMLNEETTYTDLLNSNTNSIVKLNSITKSILFIKSALVKIISKKEGADLFLYFYNYSHKTQTELKKFIRDVRIGEILILMTLIINNKDESPLNFLEMLKNKNKLITTYEQMNSYPIWVVSKHSSSTIDGKLSTQFLTSNCNYFLIYNHLEELLLKFNAVEKETSTPNKRTLMEESSNSSKRKK